MERIDDDEAHELAAKLVHTIKSNVGLGLGLSLRYRDSRKQVVQQNYDVTDEKRHRCKEECSAGEPTCLEFAELNSKDSGEIAEPCWTSRSMNHNRQQLHNNCCDRPSSKMLLKGPDEQQSEARQFLGGQAFIQDNVQVAATPDCDYASSLISNKEKCVAKSIAYTGVGSVPDLANRQTNANGHTDGRDKWKGACRLECPTSDEIFEIWGFDEEQRKQAKWYLSDNAEEGSIMHEKENIPLLGQNYQPDRAFDKGTLGIGRTGNVDSELNSTTASFGDMTNVKKNYTVSASDDQLPFEEEHQKQKGKETQNILVGSEEKLCKVCPDCSGVNLQNANWCEECGKALVTVQITRKSNAQQSNLLPNALPVDIEKQIAISNTIFSSKLNPNSAEFVSAFAKKIEGTPLLDNDLPFRYDTVTGNEKVSGSGWEDIARNRYMPDPVASFELHHLESSKVGKRNTWKVEQQHSANLIDSKKLSRKRDTNVRKWKGDNQKERSYSSDKIPSTFNQYSYLGSFEPAPKGYVSSVNPKGEQTIYYQSPSSNPESLRYNQASHSFGMESQRERSASCCNATQNSPCGNFLQMSYSAVGNVDTHRGIHQPFDDNFQRLNPSAVYQRFDFQNPAFENSSMGLFDSFDEAQFSRDLVQSQLNNQIELLYGNWEAPPAHCVGSTDNGTCYRPLVAYPQHVSQKRDLQSWRMYRKKKVVDNFIDSPRMPRSVTRKGKHHAKSKKTERQNGYSEVKAKAHHITHVSFFFVL